MSKSNPIPAESESSPAAGLYARLEELEAELAALTARPAERGAQVQYGKRAGDHIAQVTDDLSRARAAEQVAKLRDQVRRALERIAAGGYGICESCDHSIPQERLQALPWAVRCVACAALP